MKNNDFFEIVKENKLLREVFDYDLSSFEDIDDYKREFDGEIEENIVNNTTWLYRGDGRLTMMLGLYKDNIIAISDDFFLLKFCDYFQDIPFEIYRLKFDFFENERETYINNLKNMNNGAEIIRLLLILTIITMIKMEIYLRNILNWIMIRISLDYINKDITWKI